LGRSFFDPMNFRHLTRVVLITAFQVCRLVAVLMLVGPLFQWLGKR
jgi:hypothetical protein